MVLIVYIVIFEQSSHNKWLQYDAQKARASEPGRVCRAWHLTREVQVLLPGIRRAEG